MMHRAPFERFINEKNRPQWIAFLQHWYQAHGSKPVDASMLIEEFQKSGMCSSASEATRRDTVSLINKMVWHAAGWSFDAFVIAHEGVGGLGRLVYRVCCFARPTIGSQPESPQGDE